MELIELTKLIESYDDESSTVLQSMKLNGYDTDEFRIVRYTGDTASKYYEYPLEERLSLTTDRGNNPATNNPWPPIILFLSRYDILE